QNIQVDHGFGIAQGCRSQVTGKIPGADQLISAIGEGHEDKAVMPFLVLQALVEARQERRSAPVIQRASCGGGPVVVRAHNHTLVALAAQLTTNVWGRSALYRLLGQMVSGTACLGE